jgi:hypothetical protein
MLMKNFGSPNRELGNANCKFAKGAENTAVQTKVCVTSESESQVDIFVTYN